MLWPTGARGGGDMRLGLHLATLCCAAAFAAHPPIASSRRATVRMEVDEKTASDKPPFAFPSLPFAFPSLQTLVFGFLGCQTTYTLSNEIPRLLTGATPAPYLSVCLLYTSPSPRDATLSRMPSSA